VVSGGRQKICQKCKAVANSLSQLQINLNFSFHNQFWFLSAYLIELNPSIQP
jgi:hypothetical protein